MVEALGEEQQSLRRVINAMRRAPDVGLSRLSSALEHLTRHLSRSWDATVSANVEPPELAVPDGVEDNVVRITREAVANAVRHGAARNIDIQIKQADGRLDIAIGDDGRGFAFQGRMADGELASYAGRPRSLHDRIVGMGGTLTVTSGKTGAKLEISLPLQAAR